MSRIILARESGLYKEWSDDVLDNNSDIRKLIRKSKVPSTSYNQLKIINLLDLFYLLLSLEVISVLFLILEIVSVFCEYFIQCVK